MKTALVLDDQTAYTRALARSLRGSLEIVGAETLQRARDVLRPDMAFALVDICLSTAEITNREGLDFVRWLREKAPGICIIAMSAKDDPDIPAMSIHAGADRFLSKPLKMTELRQILADFEEKSS